MCNLYSITTNQAAIANLFRRMNPHARERAFDFARRDPPPSVSSKAAAVAIAELLDGIGDTRPECPAR